MKKAHRKHKSAWMKWAKKHNLSPKWVTPRNIYEADRALRRNAMDISEVHTCLIEIIQAAKEADDELAHANTGIEFHTKLDTIDIAMRRIRRELNTLRAPLPMTGPFDNA